MDDNNKLNNIQKQNSQHLQPKDTSIRDNFKINAKPMSPSNSKLGSALKKPETLKISTFKQNSLQLGGGGFNSPNYTQKQSTYNSPMFRPANHNGHLGNQHSSDMKNMSLNGGNMTAMDDTRSHYTNNQQQQQIEGIDSDAQYRLDKTKQDLDDTIKDLDLKLNRVLMKQEYDYLKGYNIYVKRKEKELRDLIQKLSDKNQNISYKDDKLSGMEMQMQQLRDDQMKMEKQKQELREKIKFWKNKADMFESEKNFLYKQTMDTKKKNKLLKVAIGKLQSEIEKLTSDQDQKQKVQSDILKSQVFLTDLMNLVEQDKNPMSGTTSGYQTMKPSPRLLNQSTANHPLDQSQLQDLSTMQFSLLDKSTMLQHSTTNKTMHKRYQSLANANTSRYANIPTENIKFEKFIDLLYRSKMSTQEVKDEIKSYVKVVETNYCDTIRDLKQQNERLVKKLKKVQSEKVNNVIEKNELESLFVDSIEDVRRDIMKRRLKNEIIQKKKGLIPMSSLDSKNIQDGNDQDAKEFEESLVKLASLAKGKIRISDFSTKDRFNLLDLFVNNEKTLIKVYEALFPHRTQNNQNNNNTSKSLNSSMIINNNNISGDISLSTAQQNIKSIKALNLSAINTQQQYHNNNNNNNSNISTISQQSRINFDQVINQSSLQQSDDQRQQQQYQFQGQQIYSTTQHQYQEQQQQQQQHSSILTSENNQSSLLQNQTMFPKIQTNIITSKQNINESSVIMSTSNKYQSLRGSGAANVFKQSL